MLTCVIVDDEPDAADALLRHIKEDGRLAVIGIAYTVKEAFTMITEKNPKVVFLDIVLGNHTAFELLEKYEKPNFETIFTTAYGHFAIQAIRAGAFDYLLKPVLPKQLKEVLRRLEERTGKEWQLEPRYQLIKEYVQGDYGQIAIPDVSGFRFLKIKEIIHIHAQGNYCDVYTSDTQKVTVTRKLKTFDSVLSSHGFCRIHNSHIINLAALSRYLKGDGGQVVMNNGQTIYVSKLYRKSFLAAIEHFKKL